jgi:hypothetical protein
MQPARFGIICETQFGADCEAGRGLIAAVPFAPPNEPHSPSRPQKSKENQSLCVNPDEKSALTKEFRRRFVTQNRLTNFLISSIFLNPVCLW